MSKSLKIIQVLAKIGKVLSVIAFVVSIIGAIGLLALIAIFMGIKDLSIEGTTLISMLESEGFSFADMIFTGIVSTAFCIGSAIIAKFASKYFSNEIEDGTPFTYDGARELRRLGILAIAIPAGIALVSSITFVILKQFYPSITNDGLSGTLEIGLGVTFIIVSVIFQYGAEFVEKDRYADTNEFSDIDE